MRSRQRFFHLLRTFRITITAMSKIDSRLLTGTLLTAGLLSVGGYLVASFGLRGFSSRVDVASFLVLFGLIFVIYLFVVAQVRRADLSKSSAIGRQVLLWSLFMRLAMLPAGLGPGPILENLSEDLSSSAVTYQTFLLYDNDIWRYLWDGHVSNSGVNPYRFSPGQIAELAEASQEPFSILLEEDLWRDVFENLSYRDYGTIYPPGAQFAFQFLNAVAPASVFFFKFFLICMDLGSCVVLVKILRIITGRPGDAVVYAWNPLVIKEFAGSGHIDALMIFGLLLAVLFVIRGAQVTGMIALAFSVLAKLSPILLVGLFLRRVRPLYWAVLPLSLLIGYLPFAASVDVALSNLRAFSQQWVFNPGLWLIFEWTSHLFGVEGRIGADALSIALTFSVVLLVSWKESGGPAQLISANFLILGSTVLFSAAAMPWYFIWALPFAAFCRSWSWIALTGLSLLSYLIFIDGVEQTYWLWIEYTLFFVICGWDLLQNRFSIRPTPRAEATNQRSPL